MKKLSKSETAIIVFFLFAFVFGRSGIESSARIFFFVTLVGLAFVPLWLGPTRFRLYGAILLVLALSFGIFEISDAMKMKEQRQKQTNPPANSTN